MGRKDRGRKRFFFEKKKQKTFSLGFVWRLRLKLDYDDAISKCGGLGGGWRDQCGTFAGPAQSATPCRRADCGTGYGGQ
jgi:hypothetical protein